MTLPTEAFLSPQDWQAVALTAKLALTSTLALLLLAVPLAWWLTSSLRWYKSIISALVSLPLILPPTVLGFYLLVLLGPEGIIGENMLALGLNTLPFTFEGLVIASMLYSLPFAVQPLQSAFESLGKRPAEVAATLRAGPVDRFFTVILPLVRPAFASAAILTFAHTIGEFGVVLMMGGNIPGETRVLSIAIYDHVEATEFAQANHLALLMLLFSFSILLLVRLVNGRQPGVNAS